jgi:hypothetical protein
MPLAGIGSAKAAESEKEQSGVFARAARRRSALAAEARERATRRDTRRRDRELMIRWRG